MDVDRLSSIISRVFLFGAFAFLALAVLEWLLNFAGSSIPMTTANARTFLDYSAILLLFVIVLLLRQIREKLEASGA